MPHGFTPRRMRPRWMTRRSWSWTARSRRRGPAKDIESRGAGSLGACDGGVVVAGFQNSHVHFIEPKFAGAKDKPAAELAAAMTAMLNRYGFTTVVDAASILAEHGRLAHARGDRRDRRPAHPDSPAAPCFRRTASRSTCATCRRSSRQPFAARHGRGGARSRAGKPRRRRGRDQAFPHDAAGKRPLLRSCSRTSRSPPLTRRIAATAWCLRTRPTSRASTSRSRRAWTCSCTRRSARARPSGIRRSSRRCSRRTSPSCRRCSSFRTS